jgi:molecular chaperone GrpE
MPETSPQSDHESESQPLHGDETSSGDTSETGSIELSEEAAALVTQLQAELDEAVEARKRALADFRNYQRRAIESEQKALQSGSVRIVKAILPALDHFDLALLQNPESMTVSQLMSAVRIVRDEFNKSLAAHGVERIEPAAGEPFDPNRHEAVMRQPREGAEPNSIVSTLQAGYAMGDFVLRPAKVAVAPSPDD